jgi:putative membrane protein
MKIRKLFSDKDREAIADAVKSVEKVTSGEIVPVCAEKSGHYESVELWFSLGLAYCAAAAAYAALVIFPHWSSPYIPVHGQWLLLSVHIIGFAAGLLLMRISRLKSLFIFKGRSERRVYEAALLAFYEQGLYKTRDRTGILIYVSLLEKSVIVLGDTGINEKVKQEHWDGVVKLIVGGIRKGNIAQGIVAGILSCKEMLKTHFPVKPDDTDELKDDLVIR